jgi:hypothetical protein
MKIPVKILKISKNLTALLFFIAAATGYAETYVPEPSNRVAINLGETPWKFSKSQTIQVHVAGNTIRYFVSTLSTVVLEILDARGKVLNRITEQGQGWHSIRLTAATTRGYNSGNGIFFTLRC